MKEFTHFNSETEKEINEHLKNIETWSKKWRLKMAPDKCSYIIFSKNKKTAKDEWFNLKIDNSLIKNDSPNEVKFLGIMLDRSCNFKKQLEYMENKLINRMNVIKHLSSKSWGLSKQTLVNIYKSVARSVIDYTGIFFNIMPYVCVKKQSQT